MPRTILQLVQSYTRKRALPVPTSLIASTDAANLQWYELMNEAGRKLCRRASWEVLKKRKTFVGVATEDQGAIATIIGADVEHIIPKTFYNDTQRLPVYGPVGDEQYQQIKTLLPLGPLLEYRVQGGQLIVTGEPVLGQNFSLIYKSTWWLRTAAAAAPTLADIAADTNVSVFPDDLMLAALELEYRDAKQLPTDMAQSALEKMVITTASSDNVGQVLRMHDGYQPAVRPAIIVPSGNWNV